MVNVKKAETSNRISVKSTKETNVFGIKDNLSEYYAKLSERWASSESLVNGIDYSSKYYAEQSRSHEEAVDGIKTEIQVLLEGFDNEVKIAKDNIEQNRVDSVTAINNIYSFITEDMRAKSDETLATIQAKSNEGVESIENEANNSLEELISLKSSTLNEVNNTKIEATSSITTLSNDYISQINTTGKSYNTLTNKQITNCILEIPQRIKYTLEDGTLTIKAGSVVIVPYGVEDLTAQYPKGATFLNDNFKVYDTQFADGKFFVWAEVQSDILETQTYNGDYDDTGYLIDIVANIAKPVQMVHCVSGDSPNYSGSSAHVIYNTSTNICSRYASDKTLDCTNISLIFCICSSNAHIVESVNQVFNGMGYIGSTVWVDKGVKGLIPNGRNEDGTLNNIEYASDRIFMRTFNSTVADSNLEELIFCPFDSSFPYFTGSAIKGNYITNDGFLYNKNTDSILKGFSICFLSRRSGKVTEMIPKQPFRAIDYSDKSEVSGWSMPSSKPIELSWGAYGTEYTAPCNGFFDAGGRINNNGYIALWNKTINLSGKSCSSLDNFLLNAWIFANKGDVVQLQYVNYVSNGGVRFFPCVGCEGEV